MDKVLMLICVFTFILFFYDHIKKSLKQKSRYKAHQRETKDKVEGMHVCVKCGKSDASDPELEFRYRNEGNQPVCYCNHCRN